MFYLSALFCRFAQRGDKQGELNHSHLCLKSVKKLHLIDKLKKIQRILRF